MTTPLQSSSSGASGSGNNASTLPAGRNPERTPSRVLRDFASRPDITNTEQLVSAYNACADDQERAVLREWLEAYVQWSDDNATKNLKPELFEEYSKLG